MSMMATDRDFRSDGEDPSLLFEVIGKIHERSSNPENWDDVLRDLARLAGAAYALVIRHDHAPDEPRVRASYNCPPGLWLCDGRTDQRRPGWWHTVDGMRAPGTIAEGRLPAPSSDPAPGITGINGAGPEVGEDRALFACIAADAGRKLVLILARPMAMPGFSCNEVARVQRVVNHLSAAWEVHQSRIRKDYVGQGTVEALNLLAVGVMIVDSRGRILERNESARTILCGDDGLGVANGRLAITGRGEGVSLAELFDGAMAPETTGFPAPIKLVIVPRPSGKRPFSLMVCPLAGTCDLLNEEERAALVFVSDPDHVPNGSGNRLLGHIYGLTPAEARIASLVAQGLRINEIADLLDITINTARTHLKRVFEKTSVERQAQLVQLLYGSVGLLRGQTAELPPPADETLGAQPRAPVDGQIAALLADPSWIS